MNAEFPILEFDIEREAVIDPVNFIKPMDVSEYCVLPIYNTVIDKLNEQSLLTHLQDIQTSMGPMPVYNLKFKERDITVVHPGL